MSCPKDQAKSIKAEISSQSPSQSTVNTLRQLLSKNLTSASSATATKTKAGRTTKTGNARSRAPEPVTVHGDESARLSPREKYALATELINSCLKVLTGSAKPKSEELSTTQASRASLEPAAPCRQVLQARSANAIPGQTSPCTTRSPKGSTSASADAECDESGRVVVATAECARLCFAFLRSADTQKLGVRAMSPLQLEKGMMSLVSKLITHCLPNLAARELVVLKQRLQDFGREPSSYPKPINSVQKETVVSLLHINVDSDAEVDLLQLAVAYQQNVLRVISSPRSTSQHEELLRCVSPDSVASPSALITRLGAMTGDQDRAAKQLDSLAWSLCMLCPNTAQYADEIAMDPRQSARPDLVLRLQVIALRIRKLWWATAKHEPDVKRELLDPLWKCLNAFLSRTSNDSNRGEVYSTVSDAFSTLELSDLDVLDAKSSDSMIDIENILYSAAANAYFEENAAKWAKSMLRRCQHRDMSDSRRLTQSARHLRWVVRCETGTEHLTREFDDLRNGLQSTVTGSAADYSLLLVALSELSSELFSSSIIEIPDRMRLTTLAAGFALRYSKSYPGQKSNLVEAVVSYALYCSQTVDDMLSWVTEEAARIFIRGQVLDAVKQAASTKPLAVAWSVSQSAISLSRILKALVILKLRVDKNSDGMIDDDALPDAARGALLEIQLKYAADLATKSKYGSSLKKLLPSLLAKLNSIYTNTKFPLRRARVALAVLRLHEISTQMVSPETLEEWDTDYDHDELDLGQDGGLQAYGPDIKAAINVSRAFISGRPQLDCIESSIATWRRIVDDCCSRNSLYAWVDNIDNFVLQLRAIASYLAGAGEEHACLTIRNLLQKLITKLQASNDDLCDSKVELAYQYLCMGYAERSQQTLFDLDKLLQKAGVSRLTQLRHTLVHAECQLAFGRSQELAAAFERLREEQESLMSDKIPREQKREYERLHAQGWLLHSQYMFGVGMLQDGLKSAKLAMCILNSIWASLERSMEIGKDTALVEEPEAPDTQLSNLSKGVSKLNLTSQVSSKSGGSTANRRHGPKFWPFVPLLIKALLHLSDAYVFHGLFGEANYYSNRAIGIAESAGASQTTSRIKSHRAQLLVVAGRAQDAELCLSQDDEVRISKPSSAAVDRLKAQASVQASEGSLEEAIALYDRAEQMLYALQSESFIDGAVKLRDISQATVKENGASERAQRSRAGIVPSDRTGRTTSKSRTQSIATNRARQTTKTTKRRIETEQPSSDVPSTCVLMSQRRAEVALLKARLSVRLGQDVSSAIDDIGRIQLNCASTQLRRQVDHAIAIRRALAASELDVTFNALSESTLICPALTTQQKNGLQSTNSIVSSKTIAKLKKSGTQTRCRSKTPASESCEDLFQAARNSLQNEYTTLYPSTGIIHTHLESGLLASSSFLLSAVSPSFAGTMQPIDQSLIIDLPRVKALYLEQRAMVVDTSSPRDLEALGWPSGAEHNPSPAAMSAVEFQEQYIDIIPEAWTTVSLCLNLDRTELYVARYRAGDSPLALRIPFSRHESETLEVAEEPFSFDQGKAELTRKLSSSRTIPVTIRTVQISRSVKTSGGLSDNRWINVYMSF